MLSFIIAIAILPVLLVLSAILLAALASNNAEWMKRSIVILSCVYVIMSASALIYFWILALVALICLFFFVGLLSRGLRLDMGDIKTLWERAITHILEPGIVESAIFAPTATRFLLRKRFGGGRPIYLVLMFGIWSAVIGIPVLLWVSGLVGG